MKLGAVETELQFLYRGGAPPMVPTELANLALAGSRRYEIVDTYFDTSGLALRRAGCTLRIRQVEDVEKPMLTWKGSSDRKQDVKRRPETEVPLDRLPVSPDALVAALRRLDLWKVIRKSGGLDSDTELLEIGRLRNDRSAHTYARGLHRLELTWDRLEYPTGPEQVRLEIEVKSDLAGKYLKTAKAELKALFDGGLRKPGRGKASELCHRLYPELVT